MDKRKKIKELEDEVKRKQSIFESSKQQNLNYRVSQIANIPSKDELANR